MEPADDVPVVLPPALVLPTATPVSPEVVVPAEVVVPVDPVPAPTDELVSIEVPDVTVLRHAVSGRIEPRSKKARMRTPRSLDPDQENHKSAGHFLAVALNAFRPGDHRRCDNGSCIDCVGSGSSCAAAPCCAGLTCNGTMGRTTVAELLAV